jgi:hypothetical protein
MLHSNKARTSDIAVLVGCGAGARTHLQFGARVGWKTDGKDLSLVSKDFLLSGFKRAAVFCCDLDAKRHSIGEEPSLPDLTVERPDGAAGGLGDELAPAARVKGYQARALPGGKGVEAHAFASASL